MAKRLPANRFANYFSFSECGKILKGNRFMPKRGIGNVLFLFVIAEKNFAIRKDIFLLPIRV